MNTHHLWPLILLCTLSTGTLAATVSEYVTACTSNQANRMGPELCECVGQRVRREHGQTGLDYLYYGVSKQGVQMNQVLAGMDAQQKVGIMMFSMQAPSECASELAKLEQMRQDTAPPAATSGAAEASAEAADSAR